MVAAVPLCAAEKGPAQERALEARDEAQAARWKEMRILRVVPVVYHAPSEQALDLVFMGDGFPEGELEDFRQSVRLSAAQLLLREPWAYYAPRINIWRMDIASPQAGIACLGYQSKKGFVEKREVKSPLGARIDANGRLSCDRKVVGCYAAELPWVDGVAVVARDYGGAVACAPGGFVGPSLRAICGRYGGDPADLRTRLLNSYGPCHELGHGIGQLRDEYSLETASPAKPEREPDSFNETIEKDPLRAKWHYWNVPEAVWRGAPWGRDVKLDARVGLFEGCSAAKTGAYRPCGRCVMMSGDARYCPPCLETLHLQLARRLPRFGSLEPAEGRLQTAPEGGRRTFRFRSPALRVADLDYGHLTEANKSFVKEVRRPDFWSIRAFWFLDGKPLEKGVREKRVERPSAELYPFLEQKRKRNGTDAPPVSLWVVSAGGKTRMALDAPLVNDGFVSKEVLSKGTWISLEGEASVDPKELGPGPHELLLLVQMANPQIRSDRGLTWRLARWEIGVGSDAEEAHPAACFAEDLSAVTISAPRTALSFDGLVAREVPEAVHRVLLARRPLLSTSPQDSFRQTLLDALEKAQLSEDLSAFAWWAARVSLSERVSPGQSAAARPWGESLLLLLLLEDSVWSWADRKDLLDGARDYLSCVKGKALPAGLKKLRDSLSAKLVAIDRYNAWRGKN